MRDRLWSTVIALAGSTVFGRPLMALPTLLAGWDFQTTSHGGTAITPAPNTPKVFQANFGTGAIYFDGTHGSDNWVTATTGNELTAGIGSTVNVYDGFSSTTSGNAGLTLLAGANTIANGKYVVFVVPMAGYQDLYVSYAGMRSNTGFSRQSFDFSADGLTWTHLQNYSTLSLSYNYVTLDYIPQLDNSQFAYLRFSGTEAAASVGLNRFDNIQFKATPIDGLPGDYNSDGYVDAADYTVWADGFGQTGTGLGADGNTDGVVDAADYTIWADHFGQGVRPGAIAGSIPEPMGIPAIMMAGMVSLRRRRQ